MAQEYTIPSASGLGDLYVCVWAPQGAPRGVVQLTHGMAEHIRRYDAFADFLTQQGYLVVGQDQAGHGRSVPAGGTDGYFGSKDGWTNLVEDMRRIYTKTKADHPDVPYILFGHSMGSFLARSYAARYGEDMDGFVFSGTAGKNPALPIAKWLARREIRKNGEKTPSKTMDRLAFGAYGKAIPNAKTAFDWLSTDAAIVEAYIADPKCGFVFTAAGFRDLFDGLTEINDPNWAARVPDKPILLISGEEDPVGGKKAAGVREVVAALTRTGHRVTTHIYPGGRHEMLNEAQKEQVYADVLSFLEGID